MIPPYQTLSLLRQREIQAENRRMRRWVAHQMEFYHKHARALSGMAGDVHENRPLATQPKHEQRS